MLRALGISCFISLAISVTGDDDCNYKGKIYKQGEQFNVDCNLCFCTAQYGLICTQRSCKMSLDSELTGGDEYDCDYKGKMHKIGEKFTDECNVCFCIGRKQVICTEKSCHVRPDPELKEGDKYTCYCNGTRYNIGKTFTDGCTVCTCEGVNAFICKPFVCLPYKRNKVTQRQICSPDGKAYQIREKVTQTCKKCLCGRGIQFYCEDMNCFPSNGTERVSHKDSCYYKRKLYKEEERFLNYCNICVCTGNDQVFCMEDTCDLHLLSLNNYNQDLDSECEYKGYFYKRGQTFLDGCTECYCPVNGEAWCLRKSCPSYIRLLRIEDSCEYNGFFISKNQHFIDDDCQSCKCVGNDHFICRQRSCNSWGHIITQVPEHLAESCANNGKVYKIIDEITNDAGNVTTLYEKWLLTVKN